ncbi:DNA polymerase III subunit gamma/tau [Chloroflexota bacterium]
MTVFYRKWRPQSLAEVVGQEPVTQTLLNALGGGRLSHAYLFCGPRGTGKTSTGRILAKAVNCLTDGKGEPCNTCDMCRSVTEGRALDVVEIDAASNRSIDDVRDLREKVNYTPSQARYKVYIIDEVHMLTKEAANALLKTLEEPPPHVIFVLATTETHKVLPTILSRCQRFDFRRLSQADVAGKLARICDAEGCSIELGALQLMAKSATGSLRDAENLLEQLVAYYGSEIELAQVQAVLGVTGDWRVKELVRQMTNDDTAAGMVTINSVGSDGLDLRQFNRELVEYLRGLLLVKTGAEEAVDLTADDMAELKEIAVGTPLPKILRAVRLFGQLEIDNYTTLPLELALVECTLPAGEVKEPPAARAEDEPRHPAKAVASTPARKPAVKPEPAAKPEPEPAAAIPAPPEQTPVVESEPEAKPEPVSVSPAPPPEITPEPATENGGEIERLRLNWRQVIEDAPPDIKKTNAIALLRSSGVKPVTIDGDIVVLAFRYNIHKDNMEKPENRQVAEQIISAFLRRPCQVRCVYQPQNNHLVKAALNMGAQVTSVEEK